MTKQEWNSLQPTLRLLRFPVATAGILYSGNRPSGPSTKATCTFWPVLIPERLKNEDKQAHVLLIGSLQPTEHTPFQIFLFVAPWKHTDLGKKSKPAPKNRFIDGKKIRSFWSLSECIKNAIAFGFLLLLVPNPIFIFWFLVSASFQFRSGSTVLTEETWITWCNRHDVTVAWWNCTLQNNGWNDMWSCYCQVSNTLKKTGFDYTKKRINMFLLSVVALLWTGSVDTQIYTQIYNRCVQMNEFSESQSTVMFVCGVSSYFLPWLHAYVSTFSSTFMWTIIFTMHFRQSTLTRPTFCTK